ncbi:MAG: integrase arm-type DNA-binding domain-containing protein [Campylobacterales bacterium]
MARNSARKGAELLSDRLIKGAAPKDKDYLLSDGKGLYLNIRTIGTKVWTIRYTIDGKPKKTTLGNYPAVSLAAARKKRDEFLEKVMSGIDPVAEKKQQKAIEKQKAEEIKLERQRQFHLVALEWLMEKLRPEVAEITFKKTFRAVERDLLPYFALEFKANSTPTFQNVIASRPINDIKHYEIAAAIQRKGTTALDTARRLLTICNRIWRYAVVTGRCDSNIAASVDASIILPKAPPPKHFASTTDLKKLKEILDFSDNYKGSVIVKAALRILPYLCVRMGNLRKMKWEDIDLQSAIWTVKEHKTARHVGALKLPLPRQVLTLLEELRPLTGHSIFVFPQHNDFGKPMSDNTLSKAYRDAGFIDTFTPHGWRTAFKSIAEERASEHGMNSKVIEACLFHRTEKDKIGQTYGRLTNYLQQMHALMQWWANFLDGLRDDRE